METLLINVPDNKSALIKQLLKELGATIESETKARQMAQELDREFQSGEKFSMDEIVDEVKAYRSSR